MDLTTNELMYLLKMLEREYWYLLNVHSGARTEAEKDRISADIEKTAIIHSEVLLSLRGEVK